MSIIKPLSDPIESFLLPEPPDVPRAEPPPEIPEPPEPPPEAPTETEAGEGEQRRREREQQAFRIANTQVVPRALGGPRSTLA